MVVLQELEDYCVPGFGEDEGRGEGEDVGAADEDLGGLLVEIFRLCL